MWSGIICQVSVALNISIYIFSWVQCKLPFAMKSSVLVSFQFSYFSFQPVIPYLSGEDIFFFSFSFRTNLEHS